jgi:hypothetical protein
MSIIIKADELHKSFTTVKNVKLKVLKGISIDIARERAHCFIC